MLGILLIFSPIAKWVSIAALSISVLVLVVQAVRREPLKAWGISSAALLLLVLVFSGISSMVYSDGLFGSSTQTEETTDTGSGADDGDDQFESSLSYEEEQYLAEIVGVYNEMAEITDRQVDIYNYCLEVCDPESYSERTQNMQESSDLLDEAYNVLPPSGYENVDDSMMSAMETANDLNYRIALDSIGSTEGSDSIDSINADISDAYEQSPSEEAQTILGQAATIDGASY